MIEPVDQVVVALGQAVVRVVALGPGVVEAVALDRVEFSVHFRNACACAPGRIHHRRERDSGSRTCAHPVWLVALRWAQDDDT